MLVGKIKSEKPAIKLIEEIFNSITHGLGAVAAIVGLVLGIVIMTSTVSFKIGFIIYASSLIILMLASTLYHALTFTKANKVFQAIDHSSIFILIAGGILYTVGTIPFAFKKPFAHFSWHLFVIAAAVAQFFAIIKLA
jgi:hemolysin III